jgi:DNA-binding MarR family transcriptional regulator
MALDKLDSTMSSFALAKKLRELLGRGARRVRIEPGPPVPKLAVIGMLSQRGPLSTNDLAALERVRPQSMTATVKALEEEGLVRRSQHPTDRRKTLIKVTAKGEKLLNEIFTTRETWLTKIISEELNEQECHDLWRGLIVIEKIIMAR